MTPELSGSGVPLSSADVLTQLYVDAGKKLAKLVLNPPGSSASSQAFNQARAASLTSQINQIIAQLNAAAADWIGPNLSQAMIDGVTRANQQMKNIGVLPDGSPMQGSLSLVDQGTMKQFAKDIYADLSSAGDSMGKTAAYALTKTAQNNISESQLDQILAGGVVSGVPQKTITQLRDALSAVDGGKVTIIDKNGDPMEFDAGYYASMVVRTKTREATVQSRHDRLQQEGLDLVSIVGLLSKNFCTAYLGQVFSLSGNSEKYPALSELPGGGRGFHPLCSKSTRPFVEDLASDQQLDQADGVDDSDKLLNVDPSTAQRRFKDLQIYQQVKQNYATTAKKLFGKSAA